MSDELYKNFEDYAENDPEYLLRVLEGRLHEVQDELHFLDKSSYRVSRTKMRIWYLNGQLHREDGPAIRYFGGSTEWWMNGERHREDGPAIEYADGTKEWYLNGKLFHSERRF